MDGLDVRHDYHGQPWQRITLANLSMKEGRPGKERCVFRVWHCTGRTGPLAIMAAEFNCVAWLDPQARTEENLRFVTTCGHTSKAEIFCFGSEKICTACMQAAIAEKGPMRRILPEAA